MTTCYYRRDHLIVAGYYPSVECSQSPGLFQRNSGTSDARWTPRDYSDLVAVQIVVTLVLVGIHTPTKVVAIQSIPNTPSITG